MRVPLPALDAAAGATVVTPTRRLARVIARWYDRRQREQGRALWEQADVLPWSAWLNRRWHEHVYAAGRDEPVLLSQAQEGVLWERIIEASPESPGLLDVPGAAAEARNAYALLHSWLLPQADPSFALFEDSAAFQGWARQFDLVLADNGWLSPARLEAEIGRRVEQGEITPPGRLLHAGFDEMTPAAGRLLGALRGAGCVVEEISLPQAPGHSAVRTGLPDCFEELRAAARWARARLEASPEATIGVAAAGLSAVRKIAERVFEEALAPDFRFHISAGPAVTEVPVTDAALRILALGSGGVSCADAGFLLRSPFIAGAEREMGPRAMADAELRRRGQPEVSLTALVRAANRIAPEMARRLSGLRRALAPVTGRRGASQWSRVFSRLLSVAGWPGSRALSNPEHRAVDQWHDLLSEFAALETVAGPMGYSAALSRLRRMAAGSQFAPADTQARVEVMGLQDAGWPLFDHLWVAGLEDRNWPAPPRPNPFLPPSLQRARGVPHCTAERELAYARLVTRRLLGAAAEVVVSYPKREGDTGLRPSPLIGELPETAQPEPAMASHWVSPQLEQIEDHSGPPLAGGAVQSGGVAVIEKQAACPFRAFVEFRLGARELEEPEVGFSLQERGTMVHSALEILWSELKTHSALTEAGAGELSALVSRAVEQAVARQARRRGAGGMLFLQTLERQRMQRLLEEWLEIERGRGPFEVVASERRRRISIGGLDLDIRVDRVDALPDGRHVIIDYKTGQADTGQWEGERPDAPQLPLYAATHTAEVGAVAFARLARGESRFIGLGEAAGIPKLTDYPASTGTLNIHIKAWRAAMEGLAREFAAGAAAVAPKRPGTCERCPFPAVCRIGDLHAEGEEDAGE